MLWQDLPCFLIWLDEFAHLAKYSSLDHDYSFSELRSNSITFWRCTPSSCFQGLAWREGLLRWRGRSWDVAPLAVHLILKSGKLYRVVCRRNLQDVGIGAECAIEWKVAAKGDVRALVKSFNIETFWSRAIPAKRGAEKILWQRRLLDCLIKWW